MITTIQFINCPPQTYANYPEYINISSSSGRLLRTMILTMISSTNNIRAKEEKYQSYFIPIFVYINLNYMAVMCVFPLFLFKEILVYIIVQILSKRFPKWLTAYWFFKIRFLKTLFFFWKWEAKLPLPSKAFSPK